MAESKQDTKSAEVERRYEKHFRTKKSVQTKLFTIALFIFNVVLVKSDENTNFKETGRSIVSDVYVNGTFRTGNILWDNILNECTVKPTVHCLQKNFYSYIDEGLGISGDVKVADGVCFKKNNVDIEKYSKEANIIYLKGNKDGDNNKYEGRNFGDEENEIEDDDEASETPFEEVTDALYDKGVNFLVTHDMKLRLPDMLFDGATLKISPRALTKTGALVHIDLEPKETVGEGRLFFHKIKKYIRKKLVMAAIAIILVIKLIALKLFFVFPIIFGVSTAKKLFLKLLLFIFPALSHIFKLCSWYHQNYHSSKLYHHHHLITHHHHKKPPHAVYGPPHHSGPHHSSPHHSSPHHSVITHGGHNDQGSPGFEHYPQDWELSGPGLGSEYLATDIHRNAINNFKPNMNDANDINSWGLGLPPGQSANVGEISSSPTDNQPVVAGTGGNRVVYSQGRPVGPPMNPYHRNKKLSNDPLQAEKDALIRAAALAAKAPPSPVRDEILRVSAAKLTESQRISAAKLTESQRVKAETELVRHQQQILAASDPDTIAAEKFYGELMQKVDGILSPLGANDIGCLERAVCSLYKDPFRHSPYSNLVSNELSKDSNELLPAADSQMALRYYRYVQAARDGQEQKDCLALYPDCNIDYTRKK